MATNADIGWINDLWSMDFALPNLITPRAILVAQADYLATHTSGMLDADLETAVLDDEMAHAFTIRATRLPRFRETILTATHGARLFPVSVQSDALGGPENCKDQSAFEASIRRILAAGATADLIRALLTQSRELDLVQAGQRDTVTLSDGTQVVHYAVHDSVTLN